MLVQQRGDPCQVVIRDGLAASRQLGDCFHKGHRVPDQHGAGKKAHAIRLIHVLLVVAAAKLAVTYP